MICTTPLELQMHDAIKEMVDGYGEMEKHHEDPIMAHYIGVRLHNAMENLRALVIPGYVPNYEPALDADDLADQERRAAIQEEMRLDALGHPHE